MHLSTLQLVNLQPGLVDLAPLEITIRYKNPRPFGNVNISFVFSADSFDRAVFCCFNRTEKYNVFFFIIGQRPCFRKVHNVDKRLTLYINYKRGQRQKLPQRELKGFPVETEFNQSGFKRFWLILTDKQ